MVLSTTDTYLFVFYRLLFEFIPETIFFIVLVIDPFKSPSGWKARSFVNTLNSRLGKVYHIAYFLFFIVGTIYLIWSSISFSMFVTCGYFGG